MHGIQSQPVDSIIAQPHQRVVAKKSANLVAVSIVEVKRLAPWRAISIGKVRTEFAKVVPLRTQVIVNDVENDAEAVPVRRIDEALHRVGSAVRMMRCEQIDAVVAPSARTRKLAHRHHLDMSHAEITQVAKPLDGGVKRPRVRERANVAFVNDRRRQRSLPPLSMAPIESR